MVDSFNFQGVRMKYTDLIFDLYGTLVDIHTEEDKSVWEKCAIFFGFCGVRCSAEELKLNFERELACREAQAGRSYECFPDIRFEEIMSSLLKKGGVSANADSLGIQAAHLFRISSIEYIRLYPDVREALDYLRGRGYRLWLLSNAQAVFTSCELRYLGLWNAFDGVYLSSDFGCRKPDGRFYRALIDEQKLDISKCIMIGNDRDTDIEGAKGLGMATLYMHTNLTPSSQKKANKKLHPSKADSSCTDYEYEGSDWNELVRIIDNISK